MSACTPVEMITYTGSRILEDNKTVFVGTGLPMIAAMHAQLTHAPGLGTPLLKAAATANREPDFREAAGPGLWPPTAKRQLL